MTHPIILELCGCSSAVSDHLVSPTAAERVHLAETLGASIANLGYPVGLGIPPSPAECAKAANHIINHLLSIGWTPPQAEILQSNTLEDAK